MDTQFVEQLASAAPTPGGGGASACVGALAAALASMVGNLTVGKKRYAEVEGEVRVSLARLDGLREQLLSLIDEDARAFEPLAAAYRLPKDTPEAVAAKEAALQEALAGAIEPPLAIMRTAVQVVGECELMARVGSRLALSDAGVAAAFARAAVDGASLNVHINASALADAAQAHAARDEAERLAAEARRRCDALFDAVKREVSR